MKIKEIEALVVEEDEVLVIRVGEEAFDDGEQTQEFAAQLDATALKGRYIIFSGKVEFTKVKL